MDEVEAAVTIQRYVRGWLCRLRIMPQKNDSNMTLIDDDCLHTNSNLQRMLNEQEKRIEELENKLHRLKLKLQGKKDVILKLKDQVKKLSNLLEEKEYEVKKNMAQNRAMSEMIKVLQARKPLDEGETNCLEEGTEIQSYESYLDQGGVAEMTDPDVITPATLHFPPVGKARRTKSDLAQDIWKWLKNVEPAGKPNASSVWEGPISDKSTQRKKEPAKRAIYSENNTEEIRRSKRLKSQTIREQFNVEAAGNPNASSVWEGQISDKSTQRKKEPAKRAIYSENNTEEIRRSERLKNQNSRAQFGVAFTRTPQLKDLKKTVVNIGGCTVETMEKATILVATKILRTVKFLMAIGKGMPIVDPKWVTDSGKAGRFLDPWLYILQDRKGEKIHGFDLKGSLQKAARQSLLAGYSIYVTKSVTPPPTEMKNLIMSLGGYVIKKIPNKEWPKNAVIISCEKDTGTVKKLKRRPTVMSSEWVLTGVLKQCLDRERYELAV